MNNKGYSLVELLVVVAIIGLFIGFGLVAVDALFGYSAKEGRKNVETAIESVRVETLSRSRGAATYATSGGAKHTNLDVYVEIYHDAKNLNYMKIKTADGKISEPKKLGKRRYSISYSYKNDTTKYPIGVDGDGLVIAFDRSTGRLLQNESKYVEKIYFTSGNKEYTITISPLTGKIKTTI